MRQGAVDPEEEDRRHGDDADDHRGAVAFTATIVILIGASRVYLGVHYPSDVLGGILLGTAWALLVSAVLHRLDRSAAPHTSSSEPSQTPAEIRFPEH